MHPSLFTIPLKIYPYDLKQAVTGNKTKLAVFWPS
jgi:hypothetical protein